MEPRRCLAARPLSYKVSGCSETHFTVFFFSLLQWFPQSATMSFHWNGGTTRGPRVSTKRHFRASVVPPKMKPHHSLIPVSCVKLKGWCWSWNGSLQAECVCRSCISCRVGVHSFVSSSEKWAYVIEQLRSFQIWKGGLRVLWYSEQEGRTCISHCRNISCRQSFHNLFHTTPVTVN